MRLNTEIKIERGIPITRCSIDGELVNLLRKMKPGDSFVIAKTRRGSVTVAARRNDMRVVTRSVDDETVRCWRVQ